MWHSRTDQTCYWFSSTTILRNSDEFSTIFLSSGVPVYLLKFSYIFFFFSVLQNFVQLFFVFFFYIYQDLIPSHIRCHDLIILNYSISKLFPPFFFYIKSPPLNLFHKLVKCISTIYFVGRSYSRIHVIPNPM